MPEARYRLGVDIGGTFTDLALADLSTGRMTTLKTPTVPHAPEQGIVNGLRALRQTENISLDEIGYVAHGTTIGLNSILQRKGSKVSLFVTEGFRDILNLQRLRLPVPYDFNSRLPEPLVPRSMVFGVRERLRFDGEVIEALDRSSLEKAITGAMLNGAEAIAICFLHSYINPAHEAEAASIIGELAPSLPVCLSSDVWPEMREYERAVTCVINAFIKNGVGSYFSRLKKNLNAEGVRVTPFITQSNGGVMDIESASFAPVRTLFSGPAAGVTGAAETARTAGINDFISFDMGGTSTDISVIRNGLPVMSQNSFVGGFPIMTPAVDIVSIGAGGGSIGRIDKGGLLKVGPDSAGSDPGPACYGKGKLPALTDAFLICGYLGTRRFAAGSIALDKERSYAALGSIASNLGMEAEAAADRMIQVAVANMYSELNSVMEQRGFDPRELWIVAFGGAGPLAANYIAEEISSPGVLIPSLPGALCAMGALSAEFTHDAVASVNLILSETDDGVLSRYYEELTAKAGDWLDRQDTENIGERVYKLLADARYEGQSYEIQIGIGRSWLGDNALSEVADEFHRQHHLIYGHNEPDSRVEIINLRVRVSAPVSGGIAGKRVEISNGNAAASSKRYIICRGKKYEASVYQREDIRPGRFFGGPAVVEQDDTTTLVLPGWKGCVDDFGNIRISRKDVKA